MPLTDAELARLETARIAELRTDPGKGKTLLRLALEQITSLYEQQAAAIAVGQAAILQRDATWCRRVSKFFGRLYAKVVLWL